MIAVSDHSISTTPEVPEIGMEVEINTSKTWKQKVWEVLGFNVQKPLLFHRQTGLVYLDLIGGREEAQWENCFWQLSRCAHVFVDVADFKGPEDFPIFPSISLAVTFLMETPNFLQVIFLHQGLHDIVKEEITISGNTHIIGCSDQMLANTVILRGYEKPVLRFLSGSSMAHVANITFQSDKSHDVIVVEEQGAEPTFHNCIFKGNGERNDRIVRVGNMAFPKFINCKFHRAKYGLLVHDANIKCELSIFTHLYDGITLNGNTVPYFKNCVITQCSNMGICFQGDLNYRRYHGCFEYNTFSKCGIAFYIKQAVNVVVEKCEFKDNNHGIIADSDAVVHFKQNLIESCEIFILMAQRKCVLLFTENTIIGCSSSGKGIHILSGSVRFCKDKFVGAEVMIYSETNVEFSECDIIAKGLKQCIAIHAGIVSICQNNFHGPGMYGVFAGRTAALTMLRNNYTEGMIAVGLANKRPSRGS